MTGKPGTGPVTAAGFATALETGPVGAEQQGQPAATGWTAAGPEHGADQLAPAATPDGATRLGRSATAARPDRLGPADRAELRPSTDASRVGTSVTAEPPTPRPTPADDVTVGPDGPGRASRPASADRFATGPVAIAESVATGRNTGPDGVGRPGQLAPAGRSTLRPSPAVEPDSRAQGWLGPSAPAAGPASGPVGELFDRHQRDRGATVARMRLLLAELNQPQSRFAAVHITGTNGKTTIARMTAGLLRAHGVHTGAFVSPHLQDVAERVLVDGESIAEAALFAGLARVDLAVAAAGPGQPTPSFFETMTALAFTHFADRGVDVAVVEVGRGGLRDATNVLGAGVSVIGPIALDHPDLGSCVAEIAADKADIIAPGATVVVGRQETAAAEVIDAVARQRGARQLRLGHELTVRDWRATTAGQRFTAELPGLSIDVDLPLVGRFHADNAVLALAATRARLAEPDAGRIGSDPTVLDPATARHWLSRFAAPGRCEIVDRPGRAPVWLDGAHNPAAARALAAALPEARVVLVAGIMADKDADGLLAALAPHLRHAVLAPPQSARGGDPKRHRAILAGHGIPARVADGTRHALELADRFAGPRDLVLVTGSLYTVGAAREALGLAHANKEEHQ